MYSTILLRETYAQTCSKAPEATEDDLLEAEATLDELLQRSLRVNGENHPHTAELQDSLDRSKVMLRLFRARAARAESRAANDAETKSEPPGLS